MLGAWLTQPGGAAGCGALHEGGVRRGQRHAGDDAQQRGLPGPVAPRDADQSAGGQVSGHAAHHQGWRIPYRFPTASSRTQHLHGKRSEERHHSEGTELLRG
jgi:hypothetical protein